MNTRQTGKPANGQSARGGIGSDFRRQALWLKAQESAVAVAEVVAALPRNRVADTLGIQLLRAASSSPANVAEGYGRFSQAAYRSHLSIARGSAFEVESWLDLLHRRDHVPAGESERLLAKCVEVQKLITVKMKSLSDNKTYAVREEPAVYTFEDHEFPGEA